MYLASCGTPLHIAAASGAVGCVQALLDGGANPDANATGGVRRRAHDLAMQAAEKYALAIADEYEVGQDGPRRTKADFCAIVRLLLHAGAEGTASAGTAVWAARCRDADLTREVFAQLLEPRAQPGVAAAGAALDPPAAAAAPGAAVAAAAAVLDSEREYQDAMVSVCRHNDANVIRIIVEAVDSQLFVRCSEKAFGELYKCGHTLNRDATVLKTAELMLDRGAVVSAEALVHLCRSCPGDTALLETILSARPSIEVNESANATKFEYGPDATPLDACLSSGYWGGAALLLSRGARPTKHSLSRALCGTRSCYSPMFEMRRKVFFSLIEAGADLTDADTSMIERALQLRDDAVVLLLLNNGIKPTRMSVIDAMCSSSSCCGVDAFKRLLAVCKLSGNTVLSRPEIDRVISKWKQLSEKTHADNIFISASSPQRIFISATPLHLRKRYGYIANAGRAMLLCCWAVSRNAIDRILPDGAL